MHAVGMCTTTVVPVSRAQVNKYTIYSVDKAAPHLSACWALVSSCGFPPSLQAPAPALAQLPDRLRAAVHDDLGIFISRDHAENFVDESWLKMKGSPCKQDKIKGWDNTTRRFLCRRHIVFAAKEIVSETGVHVPYGRLPLPAVDEILYELWPRE